jgi:ribosome maturation factor RimP
MAGVFGIIATVERARCSERGKPLLESGCSTIILLGVTSGPLAHFLFAEVASSEVRRSPLVQRVHGLLEPVVSRMGCELVGVETATQGRRQILRVYIDKSGGVTLEDCRRVSGQVSALLDVEDPISGAYDLEVSSPGIDRPLFTREQLARFVGHRARIRTESAVAGRRNFTGVIEGVSDDEVVILQDGERVVLALAGIDRAHLVSDI